MSWDGRSTGYHPKGPEFSSQVTSTEYKNPLLPQSSIPFTHQGLAIVKNAIYRLEKEKKKDVEDKH